MEPLASAGKTGGPKILGIRGATLIAVSAPDAYIYSRESINHDPMV
jgi:hypothetical protein